MLRKLSIMYFVLGCLGSILITYPATPPAKKEQEIVKSAETNKTLEYNLPGTQTDEIREKILKHDNKELN